MPCTSRHRRASSHIAGAPRFRTARRIARASTRSCVARADVEYRTVAQLDDAIVSWLGSLPRDVDIVAGIPRSGLLVANLLALHLNLPMTDVAGLIEGRVIQAGARFRG